jgi:zinc D-Ala-D-Ala carboxypeptidase
MRVGRYFSLQELTRTNTGFMNKPCLEEVVNLTRLTALFLDPLREEAGAIRVNSAFRGDDVNDVVGGSTTSYHRSGLAADIVSGEYDVEQLCDFARELDLPYDKMIMEYLKGTSWLHVQIAHVMDQPRFEVYTAHEDENGYVAYVRVDPE